jgi:rsbT antagonist protein RsbS
MKSERVPILKNDDVLIIPIHGELNDSETTQFQSNVLERVSKSKIRGAIIDISSLEMIDLFMARKLVQLVKMISLMDVESVVVGMRPAVAITLTEMDLKLPGLKTALTLEHAIAWLNRSRNDRGR